MSDETRLQRLGMQHLADNPAERMRLHSAAHEEAKARDARLEAELVKRLQARGISRRPG